MDVASFCRVLVGFDGSLDAAEALTVGAAVAGCDDGELTVLCVVPRVLGGNHNGAGGAGPGLRAQADALLGKVVHAASPGCLVRTSIQVIPAGGDSPGNVVMRYAEQQNFDLLVLGRRGNAGRRKTTLGRVAQRAALTSSVPVLLVSAQAPSP